ncbi:cleavage and polyadenylation specificity factor subunit 1 [Nematocida sp. AWRm77]|nr:cleavage and polyadenylation specificity factor subunit 1 [Nematocida sp. AWRm77]
MNHFLQESYIGDVFQHVAVGEFTEGEETIACGTCDRLFLYRVHEGVLQKIKEKRVFGYILGMEVVKEGGETKSTDGLLIHFEHARTGHVFFREEENEFVSTTLRYYEKQEYGFVAGPERNLSFLRVDNEHGLSFLLVSKMHFVLFSTADTKYSKVFDIQKIRPKHCVIKDAVFLRGYSVPALCFLFEDTSTDLCRASVFSVDVREKDLALFFEIESIPHGCYSVSATEDKAFMVLGANGAIFYTQWDMAGVRFNMFWNIDEFGIDEFPLHGGETVVEDGKCFAKGQDVFLFSESVLFRFTAQGLEGRASRILATELRLPCLKDTPLSVSLGDKLACVSTSNGLYAFEVGREEKDPSAESTRPEGESASKPAPCPREVQEVVLAQEFKKVFLEHEELVSNTHTSHPNLTGHTDLTNHTEHPDLTKSGEGEGEEGLKLFLAGTEFEETYREMFKAGQDPEVVQQAPSAEQKSTVMHTLSLAGSRSSIGELVSGSVLAHSEKKKEYVFIAGSKSTPLIVEMKEEIELFFTCTSKIRGYLDMFLVNAVESLYLVTRKNESVVISWNKEIDKIESEIDAEKHTLLFAPTSEGYIQVTTHSIVYLTSFLKATKKVSIPAAVHGVHANNKTYVVTKEGDMLVYAKGKKKQVKIGNVSTFALFEDSLYCLGKDGSLAVYPAGKEEPEFVSSVVSLFPSVLENMQKTRALDKCLAQWGAKGACIAELVVVGHLSRVYLVLRTDHNEVAVYRAHKDRFIKESVGNNAMYYEKDTFAQEKRRSLRVCHNFVVVPGRAHTRILCFTSNGLYMHRSSVPIEAVEETTRYACTCAAKPKHMAHTEKCLAETKRKFVVLAKGNLAEGRLFPHRYDKQMVYKQTQIESLCDKLAYSPKRNIFVAASYTEIDYTQAMMPFTVLATTELEADKLPPPNIQPVDLKPKTREYSVKIFSCEELRKSKSEEVLLSVDAFALDTNEYVTCLKVFTLPDKQSTEGSAEFIVACTTYVTDEDLISTGRVIVLEVASVVPERNRKETMHKLKPLAAEKTKGATTFCEEICGHIAVCAGTKLMVYMFDRNEGLRAVAFHDMQVFLISCASIRNILVCGDAYKGVFLFFYQREPPILHMLSQSTGAIYLLLGVGMALSGESCVLLSYDQSRHLYVHSYSPQNILSRKGSRLIARAECKLPDTVAGTLSAEHGSTFQMFLYTTNGYVYKHRMVDPSKYAALLDIQHSIQTHLQMRIGTTPWSHWASEKPAEMKDITLKEVLQSGIISEYFGLSRVKQLKIGADMGRDSPDTVKTELLTLRNK